MFTGFQKKTLFGLALVLSLRMFGISMVFPVFTLYAREFTTVPLLLGVAFSGYALTQAIFQIPFGYLSDRYGRIKILFLGMLLFSIGSFLAAFPPNIYWLIGARFLQGMGAITSTVIAFISDVFQDAIRSRAMAIIGMAFSMSFSFGMPLGSYIAGKTSISFIFMITGSLALLSSFLIVITLREQKVEKTPHRNQISLIEGLRIPDLLKIDIAGVIANFNLLSIFFVMPIILGRYLVIEHFWRVLLPMVIVGMIFSYMGAHAGDRGFRKEMGILGFVLFLAGSLMLVEIHSVDSVIILFLIFTVIFTGFSILEAILPSILTRIAPKEMVGTASGVYNMMQFTGSFLGGIGASMLYFKNSGLFGLFMAGVSIIGIVLMLTLRKSESVSYS